MSAMKIQSTTEYPPKKKKLKAKKKKKPKHLKVVVPETGEHGDVSAGSHAATPSKSAKRKRPAPATANSKGKSAGRRGRASNDSKASTAEYDINDVVIPWSEIRGNFTIPDVKPVEIFTPEWRSVEARKQEQEKQLRQESDKSEPNDGFRILDRSAAVTNSTNDESSDEDVSDERFSVVHMAKELDERRRYFEIISKKKKKRKDDGEEDDHDVAFGAKSMPQVNPELFHQLFVQSDPNSLTQEADKEPSSATSVPSITTPTQTPTSNRRSARENKYIQAVYQRSIDVRPESYIPLPHPNRGLTYGNFEELRVIDLERRKVEEEERLIRQQTQALAHHTRKPVVEQQYASLDDVMYYDVDDVIPPDSDDDYVGLSPPGVRRKQKGKKRNRPVFEDMEYIEDDDADFGAPSRPRKRQKNKNRKTPGRKRKEVIPKGPQKEWSIASVSDDGLRIKFVAKVLV
jgi:hypothetical protein